MKTVSQSVKSSFREKGSKFIGYLFPISTLEQFEQELNEIKSRYPDATHHCYAWRLNLNNIKEFAQNDGEPGGTAGLPILNKLKSFEVVNCASVVVRYYGGTNLGRSGLIRAYGQSTALCLRKADLPTLIPTQNFEVTYSYDKQTYIDQLQNHFDLKELNAQYREKVTLEIACRSEQAENFWTTLRKLEHRGIKAEQKGSGFVTIQP